MFVLEVKVQYTIILIIAHVHVQHHVYINKPSVNTVAMVNKINLRLLSKVTNESVSKFLCSQIHVINFLSLQHTAGTLTGILLEIFSVLAFWER